MKVVGPLRLAPMPLSMLEQMVYSSQIVSNFSKFIGHDMVQPPLTTQLAPAVYTLIR